MSKQKGIAQRISVGNRCNTVMVVTAAYFNVCHKLNFKTLFLLIYLLIMFFCAARRASSTSMNELHLWDITIGSGICLHQTVFGFVHNLKTLVRKNISIQNI